MSNCQIPLFLAYLGSAYILGSLYYLASTRYLGTPFNDSLTAKQLQIKSNAVKQRSRAFKTGLLASIVLLAIFRPFRACN